MKKVLVVDQDPHTVVGLSSLLSAAHTVVVTCGGIEEAERAMGKHLFDFVILDSAVSGVRGAEGTGVLTYIRQRTPRTRVIITISPGADEVTAEAYRRGAFLCFRKPLDILQMASAIMGRADASLAARKEGEEASYEETLSLSLREKEVLHWLKEGKSSWDIARILGISERTVNYHVNNIIRKLGANNRAQAVFRAITPPEG